MIAVLVAVALLGVVRVGAAGANVGVRDFSYVDLNGVQTPTEDKPQSKLWFQDGSWWGLLYRTVEHATVIERLDATTQTWVDTGIVVSRPTARGDVYLNRRNVSGRIYVVYNGTNFPTIGKLALGTWANLKVRTITAGATSTIAVTMDGVSIYSTATASLGTSGFRTLQIDNDKQLPFSLYADNIEAVLP
jgi:hypothetical protein